MHHTPRESPGKPWSGNGREELAAAVRRMATLVVVSTPPAQLIHRATQQVESLVQELSGHVPGPEEVPTARFSEHDVARSQARSMAAAMPFDMIVGACNPVAPPMSITFEDSQARGTVLFSAQYEGAPGCVHGAAIAGAFDIILTAANILHGAAGPTVELTIRYRRPTLISKPAHFVAWVTEQTDRRIHSQGRLEQDGTVCVEATGSFAQMERSRIASMHRRDKKSSARRVEQDDPRSEQP